MRKIWLLAPASALVLAGCGVQGNLNATPQGHNNYKISGHVHLTPPSTVPSSAPSFSAQTSSSAPSHSVSPSHSSAPPSSHSSVPPSSAPQSSPSHSAQPTQSSSSQSSQSSAPPSQTGQGSDGCGPACANHSQQTTPPSEPPTTGVSWSPLTLNDSGGPANPLAVQISVAVPSTFSDGPVFTKGQGYLVTEETGSPAGYHNEPPAFFKVSLSQYPRTDLGMYPIPGGLQPGPLGNGSYQTAEAFNGSFGDSITVFMPHLPNGNVGTVNIVVPQNHAAWLQVMLQSIKVYS